MSHDLFGDVVLRPRVVRARRSPIVLASIGAHTTALLAILITSAVAPGVLPTSRQALAFYEPVRLLDIELPPAPKPQPARVSPPAAVPVSPRAAPVVAPASIAPEGGFEGLPATASAPAVGVVDGAGSLDTVGMPSAPPAAPPVEPPPPIRLHSGITPPQKVFDVAPIYPEIARVTRREGIVILEAVIDASGRVQSARVLQPAPLLDEAALAAVRQWRFTPARLNGEPVPVVMTVTVQFTLR